MKKIKNPFSNIIAGLLIFCLLFPAATVAQNRFNTVLKSNETGAPLSNVSVTIKKLKRSAVSDSSGRILIDNIPDGTFILEFSHVGLKELETKLSFPLKDTAFAEIDLEPDVLALSEVTVNSTRSNRSIATTPSRVEIISDEEIHEEGEMRPGDIKMLLSESTGVQAQQTSATSGNAALRLQGLDGRYTQILKDGFPIYSGAASGLGILQTPPLDLRQVEIIKGSSSTLYGGGAIAGLINLISKVPQAKPELSFHVNGTSTKGLDVNTFYSRQFDEVGITLFAASNSNAAFVPCNETFTSIPKLQRYTLNPKMFLKLGTNTKMMVGVNSTFENRLGGDIFVIEGKQDNIHKYFERNKTQRISSEVSVDHSLNNSESVNIKNSVTYFDRKISAPDYNFNGTQYASFSEASYLKKKSNMDWIVGVNVVTDHFIQQPNSSGKITSYDQSTFGAFAQNTANLGSKITLESGLRVDYIKDYGSIILPRISALFKISESLTSRIGGGFGYKTPTIFTEDAERKLYKNLLPVNSSNAGLEKSYGVNGDVNYKCQIEKLRININELLFFTRLDHPLQLFYNSNNYYQLRNIQGNIISKGAESNIRLTYDETSLYLGYTFTDARDVEQNYSYQQTLNPKHRLNAALVYEVENKWKLGSEVYYFSPQLLNDHTTAKGYWLTGLLIERIIKRSSVYINFENIGDVRQSMLAGSYVSSISNPVFKDIYAPLEGFTANAGIKIRLNR